MRATFESLCWETFELLCCRFEHLSKDRLGDSAANMDGELHDFLDHGDRHF
jgi:hypothetical protein